MQGLIGEFNCRLDEKGRLSLPSRLRSQFPESAGNQLVVNRGFEKCLVLYTKEDWLQESAKLGEVDDFMSPDIRKFKRIFTNGANLVTIDGAQRILIPKKLLEYAGLEDDVILNASGHKVEIWNLANYERELEANADEMSKLAQNFYLQRGGKKQGE
jgi:MraZ protein